MLNGVSFVVPFFNKATTLALLMEQFVDLSVRLNADAIAHEFILVNDGSSAAERALLEAALAAHAVTTAGNFIFINRQENLGKSRSLVEGAGVSRYGTLVFLDADVPFSTYDILAFVDEALKKPNQLLVANRTHSLQDNQQRLRKFMSRLFTKVARLILGVRLDDLQTGLKAVPQTWFTSHRWAATGFALDVEILRRARRDGIAIDAKGVSTTSYIGQSSVKLVSAGFNLSWELFRSWATASFFVGLGLVIIANSRAFSRNSSVPWDARDEMWIYFRWIGSAWRAGFFGDYFPNIVSGYTLAGNPQAGVFNVFYGVIATLFANSALSINLVYFFTMMAVYVVSFWIAYTYFRSGTARLYFALAVVACGFFSGHVSHFSYLASGLSMLLIFLSLRLYDRHHRFGAVVAAALGTYHFCTAGYPTIGLFGAQIFAAVIGYQMFKNKRYYGATIGGIAIGVAVSLPALAHVYHQITHATRGAGLTADGAMFGSLPPRALLNFLVPNLKMNFGYSGAVDPTMDRFHLLFISFPLLVAGFIFSRFRSKTFFAGCAAGALFLILAMGRYGYLRWFLAEHFFLYRVGRFPSGEHRGFALVLLALATALVLQKILSAYPRFEKWAGAVVALDFAWS